MLGAFGREGPISATFWPDPRVTQPVSQHGSQCQATVAEPRTFFSVGFKKDFSSNVLRFSYEVRLC